MYEKGKKIINQISEYSKKDYKPTLNPKSVNSLLMGNNMVFLKSIYNSFKTKPNKFVFYEVFAQLVNKAQMFNFYEVGYSNDFVVTQERANAIFHALTEIGLKGSKKNFVFLDVEDYKLFLDNKLSKIDFKSLKSKNYIQEKTPIYNYFKRDCIDKASIADVIEGFKSENENSNNPYELKFKSILDSIDIKYEYQKVFNVDKKFYIVDFYIPENNIIFEIDGYIHDNKDRLIKDRERDNSFAKHGILTVRFKCSEVESENTALIVKSLCTMN